MTKKIPFLIMFFVHFFSIKSEAQTIRPFGKLYLSEWSGTIGEKLKIKMSLNFDSQISYDSHGEILTYDNIYGDYSYDKYKKRISLIGETLPDSDSLYFFELDSLKNKVGLFGAKKSESQIKGIWKDLKNNKTFPFTVQSVNAVQGGSFGYLSVDWNGKRYHLLGVENDYFQGKYKVIKTIEKTDALYIILEIVVPYCGIYKSHGPSCGGSRSYLQLHKITKNSVMYYEKMIESEDGDNIIDRKLRQDRFDMTCEIRDYSEDEYKTKKCVFTIDFNRLGLGIQQKDLP